MAVEAVLSLRPLVEAAGIGWDYALRRPSGKIGDLLGDEQRHGNRKSDLNADRANNIFGGLRLPGGDHQNDDDGNAGENRGDKTTKQRGDAQQGQIPRESSPSCRDRTGIAVIRVSFQKF